MYILKLRCVHKYLGFIDISSNIIITSSRDYEDMGIICCFLISGLNRHERRKRRKERLLQQQMQISKEEKLLQDKMKLVEDKISKQDITQLFPQFRHNQVGLTFFKYRVYILAVALVL